MAPKIVVGSVSMMADAASMTASCRLSNLASCAPSFLMKARFEQLYSCPALAVRGFEDFEVGAGS